MADIRGVIAISTPKAETTFHVILPLSLKARISEVEAVVVATVNPVAIKALVKFNSIITNGVDPQVVSNQLKARARIVIISMVLLSLLNHAIGSRA